MLHSTNSTAECEHGERVQNNIMILSAFTRLCFFTSYLPQCSTLKLGVQVYIVSRVSNIQFGS